MIKFKFNDAISEINKLKDNSVDLFYVDLPYVIKYKEWDKNREDFEIFTEPWIKACVKKLKPTGSMYVFMAKDNLFANKNKKRTKGLVNILEEYGTVHIDNWITWKRQKGRGSKHKAKSLREEIIHFTKHPTKYTWNNVEVLRDVVIPYVKDGRPRGWFVDEATGRRVRWTGIGDVWMYSSPQWNGLLDKQRHSAQKPFLLVERIILMGSNKGDLVVDPFMGSGVASHVCKYHERNYIGIDNDKDIYKDAVKYYFLNYKNIKKIFEAGIQRVVK